MTGDTNDRRVEGFLLVKTGPTENFASATAELRGVEGTVVEEVGYDIRKPIGPFDPRGSHCGGGAPRFNIFLGGAGSSSSDATLSHLLVRSP